MSSIRTPKSIRYDLPIDELKRTVTYRALKVGEQKALLTAIGMKNPQAMINSIVDIVSDCTFGELDVDKIPMHIVDYVFLHVYIKSAGNMSQAEYSCGGVVEKDVEVEEGEEPRTEFVACGKKHLLNLDLNRTTIKYPADYQQSKVVDIGDGIVVKLRLPSFEAFRKMSLDKDWLDIADQFIFSSIECIQDGDDVKVPGVDFELDDLAEWLNSLDANVMKEIESFFNGSPSLSLRVPVTCPSCGHAEEFELTSLEDFLV